MFEKTMLGVSLVCLGTFSGCVTAESYPNKMGQMTTSNPGMNNTNHQAVDWTQYVNPMKNGCDYLKIEHLSPEHKQSIVKFSTKGDPEFQKADSYVETYILNNAVAFNQPLTKIEVEHGYEWGNSELTFANNKFMSFRPEFKMPKLDSETSFISNDATGYKVETPIGEKGLEFDAKAKTIKCYY